jgi:hypothetical protein
MKQSITIIITALILLAVAFAAGRYSVKSVITTEVTKTEEKKKEDIKQDSHTVIVKAPDGTTTTTIDTHVDTHIVDTTKTTDQLVQQTNTRKTLQISLLGGYNYASPQGIDVGLSVSKEVLGPVTVGLWGMKSGIIGLSVGLNF